MSSISYRKYYWRESLRMLDVVLRMVWFGVVLNRGHHSKWNRKDAGGAGKEK